MQKKSPMVMAAAIGIGIAFFFVLGRFVAIPSPVRNTSISIQYGFLGFMAVVLGSIAGLLIALIGHILIDFSYGWGIWWAWIIASGFAGFVMGLSSSKIDIESSPFTIKKAVIFNVYQAVANIIAWGLIAPTLEVLWNAEMLDLVFNQGLVAGISNTVTTALVGTLSCFVYNGVKIKS